MFALPEVLRALEGLAPPRLAAEWDNVGLLIEGTRTVSRVALCIDLTEPVLAEALGGEADLIVAYHPPIFGRGLTRLTAPRSRVLLAAIRAGVHVYSPHSALDAARDGMTDWLVRAFGPVHGVAPIEPDKTDPELGAGRLATLDEPAALDTIVLRIKAHLGLATVRVATPAEARPIRTVAACPGAGGSVLERARGADLVLTGEMRHHDVLARVAAGGSVVLTDHTHTERGYLPVLAQRLGEALPGLRTWCSTVDADPLRPV